MATLIYKEDDGDEVSITRDIDGTYGELVDMFYSLSLGISFSQKTIDEYLDCSYNDFAITKSYEKRGEMTNDGN